MQQAWIKPIDSVLDRGHIEKPGAFRARKKYGKDLTVVVTFTNNLSTAQLKSINKKIKRA